MMDKLLVGVSGSVAVLNLPSYLATLRAELAREVRVIMTAAAASMLPPSTVALVCDGVFLDREPAVEKRPGHIELARWCEMFVVLPATANVIGQTANGLGSNLLTTTILASPKPVVFYPNVNDVMWEQGRRTTQRRNLEGRWPHGDRTRSRYRLRGRLGGDAREPGSPRANTTGRTAPGDPPSARVSPRIRFLASGFVE